MKKLEPATVPQEQIDEQIELLFEQWKNGDPVIRRAVPTDDPCEAQGLLRDLIQQESNVAQIFMNDKYQVAKYPANGGVIHLSIKRIDRHHLMDWRDLQDIKNQLVGEENEALQLFPRESRVVDMANQFHLWVYSDPRANIPVGWWTGNKSDVSLGNGKQRGRDEN